MTPRSVLSRPLLVVAALLVGGVLGHGRAAAQSVIAQVPAGAAPAAIAVNRHTNRIYIANASSNDVTVVDGNTHATTTIPVGIGPQHIAVNPATNKIYVSNVRASTVSVIDGTTHAVATLATGGSGPIAVNSVTDRIYVIRHGLGDEVNVIHGPTNHSYAMAIYSYQPVAIAVNPNTNKLYVANYTTGDVRVIDLAVESEYPPTRSIGVWSKPVALAVNPVTNTIYVLMDDPRAPIGIIDGVTDTATFLAPEGHARGPRAIAVNTATNKVYAAFSGEVVVIDGATRALTFIPSGSAAEPGPVAVAINEQTNKIYVPNAQGFVTVIDGSTHAAVNVPIPANATAVGINANTNRVYVAGPALTVMAGAPASPVLAAPPINVQGLWWRSPAGSESGWGINLVHQGETIFATWFTYDLNGEGMWLVMSNGARTGDNTYSGALYRTTGPPLASTPFDPSRVGYTAVGQLSLAFSDSNTGTLTATVNGSQVVKPITRMIFAAPVPSCTIGGASGAAPNYQDLWWRSPAGSESGWGVNLTHQGDVIFATWFTYGPDGRGMWLSASDAVKVGNGIYSGTLYRTTGPPFNAEPWNSSAVTRTAAGIVTFTFGDANNGVMAYTVEGVSQNKPITRMVFANPPTVCR